MELAAYNTYIGLSRYNKNGHNKSPDRENHDMRLHFLDLSSVINPLSQSPQLRVLVQSSGIIVAVISSIDSGK